MIPFLDLKTQYLGIKQEIDQAVLSVLDSTQFILGKDVETFEGAFAKYCGAQHAVAVNSGTSALHLALLAAGVKAGDEVITVSSTFVATVASVLYTGAIPVLVDVDPESYTMDPSKIEKVITPRTKVILPVHLYGQPADMDAILTIARKHSLVVIEDAAQAHGAEYKGRRVGGIGDLGCFSFYPGKNLGAYGEGGAILTNNPKYDQALRLLRDWGQEGKANHIKKGYNYRMDGIQGAILNVKLLHLDEWTEKRRTVATHYNSLLVNSGLDTPIVKPYVNRHVYHIYPVLAGNRQQICKRLEEAEIQFGIHYRTPVHLLPAYQDMGYKKGDLPVSEEIAAQEISLPIYPEMTEESIEMVASVCFRDGKFRVSATDS